MEYGLSEAIEKLDELLTTWFEGLAEVLQLLEKQHRYVVLSDIDSYNTWLEFKLKDDLIAIGKITGYPNQISNKS